MAPTGRPSGEPDSPPGAVRTHRGVGGPDIDLARALVTFLRVDVSVLVPTDRPARRLSPATLPHHETHPGQAVLEGIGRARLARAGSTDDEHRDPLPDEVCCVDVRTPGGHLVGVVVSARSCGDGWDPAGRSLLAFLVDFFTPTLIAFASRPQPALATQPDWGRGERRAFETQIRTAADRGELALLFQPEVDIRTREVLAAEALVRWDHPEHGRLAPDAFIAIAERSDLIEAVDLWVLRESLRLAARWPAPAGRRVTVRVNVSPAMLVTDTFVPLIGTLLAEHGLSGEQVCVEFTERLDLPGTGDVQATLRGLSALGVRSAIDDVATGYSTLSRLRLLPVDTFKIDRSLVAGLDGDARARALVSGLVAIASSLGAGVVAEGVESEAEVAALLTLGVVRAQGHLFAQPITDDAFTRILADGGVV